MSALSFVSGYSQLSKFLSVPHSPALDRQRLPTTRSGASQEKRATSPESGGGHSDAGIGSSFAGQQSSTGQVSWTRRRGRTPPRTCGVCRFRAAAAVASVVPRTRGRRAAARDSAVAATIETARRRPRTHISFKQCFCCWLIFSRVSRSRDRPLRRVAFRCE